MVMVFSEEFRNLTLTVKFDATPNEKVLKILQRIGTRPTPELSSDYFTDMSKPWLRSGIPSSTWWWHVKNPHLESKRRQNLVSYNLNSFGNVSDIKDGTFRMSDIICNPDLDNPDNDHLNNLQTYTACNNDSSSTSSDGSCSSVSIKDQQKTDKQQYMSLENSLQGPHYENIPEGKSTNTQNYEKRKAKKNRDYVNIMEQQGISPLQGRKMDQIDEDESQTSGESSSDESDDNSVDYTTVVFK
ncbi:hypothetical protein Baya_12752 [Bagarius yarrelli]|uniref:Uncharacterized protein n=1 Tax=Bagarius yarrelli TaxID=175774 RepID=A0A556V468_BAGYA|nr:hypothetical protein Baya_12752 [Bagarius yarrelli]